MKKKTGAIVMAGIVGVTTVFSMGTVWQPIGTGQIAHAKGITVVANPTGECGDGVTYIFSNGLLTISGNGKIANDAFKDASDITSVVITDGVTGIGDAAFSGCSGLSSITIADTVTTIGSCAFQDTKLTTLTLPESLTTLGAFVLKGNEGVKSLTIPRNVITMQGNVGGYHGSLCESAVETVVFAEGIEKIPSQACQGAKSLVKVTLPGTVKTIQSYAFADTAITELNIPESVTEMEAYILKGNTGVKSLTIPKNMTIMQSNAGGYHGSLCESAVETVVFAEGMIKIPNQACQGATSLTKATVPVSVEAVGNDAMTGCKNVKIYCYRDSYIDEYALQNNIAYEYVGQAKDSIITAPNYTKTSSASKQDFKIETKLEGLGVLSYSSDMAAVVVDQNGNVTIAPDFVGKATITINVSSVGEYKAGLTKIVVNVKPAKTQISKIINKKKNKMVVKWTKKSKVTGYELQYSTDTKFKKGMKNVTVSGSKVASKTISSLKRKKTYYVRIRTYKQVSGKTYYSDWSTVKKVKVIK